MILFGLYGAQVFLLGFVFYRWPTAPFQYMMMFDEHSLSGRKRTHVRVFGALCMVLGVVVAGIGLVGGILL